MASKRSSFGKDTGLQARMVFTMFMLGLVYVAFIGVLFALGAQAGVIVVVAVVLLVAQLFGSDKMALAALKVKEVSPAEEPELHGIIDRLCVQADLAKPRVCVMESPMPNAFAMGRSRKSTTVCATRGINRDVMVMTLASFFATLASLILQFSFFFGGGYGNREEEQAMEYVVLV